MHSGRRPTWKPTRAELLAAGAVLVAVVFVVQPLKAQQASRMALTAAVADHGTVRIDRYEDVLGVDFARKDGHLYSDKAPGQPLLAIPAYTAYRWVGGESAEVKRVDFNLGLWWASLWSAALPAALLVVVMARLARPWNERWSLPAALAMAFGTPLLPFGSLLFSHTLSALCVAGAVLAWRDASAVRPRLLATGFLLGAAVSVEYTAVVALVVVGLAALVRDRWASLWVALGAAAPLAALAAYQWIALGNPTRVPYRYHNLGLHNSASAGLVLPTFDRIWTLSTSDRGVFLLTPVVLLGVVGLVLAAVEHPERRTELAVVVAIFAGFFVVQAGAADLTGGESLGPRYLAPGLAPLAIGLAVLWDRLSTLCAGIAVLSGAIMLLATYSDPLPRLQVSSVLRYWVDRTFDGQMQDTIFSPLLGRSAILPILAASGWLTLRALRAHRTERERSARSILPSA